MCATSPYIILYYIYIYICFISSGGGGNFSDDGGSELTFEEMRYPAGYC